MEPELCHVLLTRRADPSCQPLLFSQRSQERPPLPAWGPHTARLLRALW